MHSALKVNGKRLYELARKNEVVERPPRNIHVYGLDILDWNDDEIQFEATVSRGTYIRVLGEDLAESLGCCGHLTTLKRHRLVGQGEDLAVQLDDSDSLYIEKKIPIEKLLPHYEKISLSDAEVLSLYQGKPVSYQRPDTEILRLHGQNGEFLGMGSIQNEKLKSIRLRASQSPIKS